MRVCIALIVGSIVTYLYLTTAYTLVADTEWHYDPIIQKGQ